MPGAAETGSLGRGDRRSNERRAADRRRSERRDPLPLWRRPWALVMYGAAAMLVLFVVSRSRPPQEAVAPPIVDATTPAPADTLPAPAEGAPVRPAIGTAAFEQLVAEGDEAVGQRVRTELYCSPITQVSVRETAAMPASLAAVADTATRVPAAECKWGPRSGAGRREDFLLIVPTEMAGRFGETPAVDDGFVQRKRVVAEIEWIGRSDALALRTAGVLRRIE
jgi:hypothetical protein